MLLMQGIGDTIRISLSDDPVKEVKIGNEILKSLSLRNRGVKIISCPSCARQAFPVIETVKILEEKLLKKNKSKLNFISFRFGTIAGVSKGMRFHTAINKFCLNASLNKRILVYKTALNQYRPYLSLRDAFKIFKPVDICLCFSPVIFFNPIL